MTTDTSTPLDGICDPRFAPVRAAFLENFTKRGEPDAAVSVMLRGEPVVDIWGGWKDKAREKPWEEDTIVNFFSVGKPLAALCILHLVERGALALDAPVADVRPEFAAHGKAGITIRHLLSHQAGLPVIREALPDDAMLDRPTMVAALERQSPWWEPGSAHGYHVNTFGFHLPLPERLIGPNPEAFGYFGAGGSLGFCDPGTGIAFAYVTNDMGPRWQNPRNAALVDAVYESLG